MCDALVCATNFLVLDFYVGARMPKRGDVISVAPDGFQWGMAEMNNPDWRIFRMAGVSVADMQPFLSPEVLQSGQSTKTLQYRGYYLNIDSLSVPLAMKLYILDGLRLAPTYTVANASTLVPQIKAQRAPISDVG